MAKITGRLVATALAVWLVGASAARAEFMGWTYSFEDSGFLILPNGNAGQASGNIGVALPPPGSAPATNPNLTLPEAITLHAATSTGDDYQNTPYHVGLVVTDTASQQTHDFQFAGQLNGAVTSGSFPLTNTFADETQDATLGGRDYRVTVGPFALNQLTGLGSIGFAVQVGGPIQGPPPPSPSPTPSPSSAPEPASLVLACLAFPALGMRVWKRKKAIPPCA